VLWLLDEGALLGGPGEAGWLGRCPVTEASTMNMFSVLAREDGRADLDVLTPRLDGTILPGVTRTSVLALAEAHPSRGLLPGVPASTRLFPGERWITLADVFVWAAAGRLREVFCAGTAVAVAPVGVLGFPGREDIVLARRASEIQEGCE
jgi:branched-chain amino acid aminotransferase